MQCCHAQTALQSCTGLIQIWFQAQCHGLSFLGTTGSQLAARLYQHILVCPRLQVEAKDQEWEKRAQQTRQQASLHLDDEVRKERVAGQGRIQEVIER